MYFSGIKKKELGDQKKIKMKITFLLSFIIWEILIIEDNDPLLFNLTDNLAERNRYE